ncbi:spt6 acidic, N-terminal domain-containing protein [Artemisia annua]|uniref:Spt6 acidic, N-terminal domain-containing protein n=1 Tax=Artemisia annua TaxID=35608 RepID=A0A2U1P468_ARTAN|nr:spt6 acidic, N-terminal domain-containing protein [Artemisia annua]
MAKYINQTKKFKRLKKARADADGGHSGFSDEEENDGTGKGGRSAENNISRSLFIDDVCRLLKAKKNVADEPKQDWVKPFISDINCSVPRQTFSWAFLKTA